MKRFHVHVAVEKLDESIRFYSSLFGVAPTVVQPDYAKWMLEEPRVNFAISQRGRQTGINHLGFQVESDDELTAMRGQLEAADAGLLAQTGAACCYAISDKYWVTDPQGVAWETFHTLDSVPVYGEDTRASAMPSACCIPLATSESQDKEGACCIPLPDAAASAPDKTCCA
jgi:catechol 2,3-dioxygenase-like lactoylglutathione lyase family enzyme